jgi:STAM-binding protein
MGQCCSSLVIIFTPPSLSLHTMTSSYGTDAFSHFRPATFQPGPYQSPNSAPSNLAQAASAPFQPQASSRPYSIAELAERAKRALGDDVRLFKSWLRIAENARRDAKSFSEQGDLESAFVEYAKAAAIVLEKIPADPDYRVLLSATQRHNMGLVSYPLRWEFMTALRLVCACPARML